MKKSLKDLASMTTGNLYLPSSKEETSPVGGKEGKHTVNLPNKGPKFPKGMVNKSRTVRE